MKRLQMIEKFVSVSSWMLSMVFVLLLVVVSLPQWWKLIVYELTPMGWFESLLLYTCALLSFGCFVLLFLKKDDNKAIWWSVMFLGFLYLSLDERFALHERIRDKVLAPLDISVPFAKWISPGDFILLIFAVIGIIILPMLLRLFKERKPAFNLFVAGVIISVLAVVMDSFDLKGMSAEFQRMEQFIEEILETSAMLTFLNAIFLVLSGQIKAVMRLESEGKAENSSDEVSANYSECQEIAH